MNGSITVVTLRLEFQLKLSALCMEVVDGKMVRVMEKFENFLFGILWSSNYNRIRIDTDNEIIGVFKFFRIEINDNF